MNKQTVFSRKNCILLLAALLLWAASFLLDTRIFSTEPIPIGSLPVDKAMVLPMHILTKVCVLLFWILFLKFLSYGISHKKALFVFLVLMAVYGAGLLVTYPGYYMNDDPIVFAYATRFLPVYWHNYLTSLFYMTSLSLFPASCGPVLLSDVCYALVYTYIFERGKNRPELLLPAILPFTLLGALMCFRPAVYSSFFLFYFVFLYFERKQERSLRPAAFVLLAFLTALLSLWRSESIVLLPFSLLFLPAAYPKGRLGKKPAFAVLSFFLLSLVFFGILSLPQKAGEKKYYGSDYLIISTTRPLSVIVWRDQTYPGAEEDLANISAVTEFGYLHNDSLSCSAYTRYNVDHNGGHYTQTGTDEETQKKYLKSAFRMIWHNMDLYLGERIQLFLVTNGIFNYNGDMVLNLKPVVSTDLPMYDRDRDFALSMLDAYKRVPLSSHQGYALFLYRFGGEALIPMLALCFILLIGSLCRKKWFYAAVFAALLAREGVIFLTAPASFIQYSYPTMYTAAAFAVLMVSDHARKKKKERDGAKTKSSAKSVVL